MAVAFYMDHHVHGDLTDQLRRRGIDVVTAFEDGHADADDPVLLARATALDRVLVTYDSDFRVHAREWMAAGREFSGIFFRFAKTATLGQLVHDLELIANATDLAEWRNRIEKIPL